MSLPAFRFVCSPSALSGAPANWAREMLLDGEIALMGEEGLDAINDLAHELDLTTISVIRREESPELQRDTVINFAGGLPLIWAAPQFDDVATTWARDRGPMTLLVVAPGPLPDEERRRIDRFVAMLGRQSE
jgi:hypothetical protein